MTPKKTQRPICSGIGFHPKTNEYKVIRMWNNYDNYVWVMKKCGSKKSWTKVLAIILMVHLIGILVYVGQ
jgi:hypothetical protein